MIWNTTQKKMKINQIGTSGKTLSRAHASTKANDHLKLANATVTCEIKSFQPSSKYDWNNFISARGNLPETISKSFQKLIAAQGYFPRCLMSLK